jgi:ABC-type glycerol-3-phosphate transport system substrate-binding protein
MTSRTSFRWLVLGATMALAWSAVASSVTVAQESAAPAAACAEGAAVVDFWTEHTPPDSDGLQSIVDAFNAANPDTCVKMTIVPGNETNIAKLLTSIRGGVGPDVYLVDRFTVAQRANEGVVAELPAEAADMAGEYLPFAWEETQFQGKTFALPFDTDVRVLFYNKDLLGEDAAALDMANGPLTIDAVNAIADKHNMTDADGNYTQLGWIPGGPQAAGNPGALDQGWHYTWGFDFGGKFADLDACKLTPTDPGVVAGYQFLYDWAKAHDPAKVSRFVATNEPDPANTAQENAFITGKIAMVVTGPWRINQMAQLAPDVDYGFTFIPVAKEGDQPTTWAGGWSAGLIPGSDVPDQAWNFIKFLAGPEGQKIYTTETTHLPTISSLLQDTSIFTDEFELTPFVPMLDGAHSRPPLAVGANYWNALTEAQGAVELNTMEPEAALQQVADTVQPDLDAVGC